MTMSVSATSRESGANPLGLIKAQHPQFASGQDQEASSPAALRHRGLEFWMHGQLDDATQMFSAAAAVAADNPTILAELGCLLRLQGKAAEAMQCFLKSLALDPRQVQVWLNAASLSNEANDKSTAEEAYLQAFALDSTCAEAAVGLGLLYVEQRRYKEGARLLGIAIERGFAMGPIYACLAQTRYLLGEFSGASIAFDQAVRLCPGDCVIVQRYARTRLIETVIVGSADAAIAVYHAVAGDHAEDILTVCRAAFQALCGYGPHEAAIRLGRALLERMPDDPVIGFHLDALMGCMCDRAPLPYLTASFDSYAPHFDKHLVEVLDYQVPAKMHSLLVDAGGKFTRLLDLGCGTGLAAPYLAVFAGKLTGVDISPGMLEKARERNLYDHLVEQEAVAYLARRDGIYDLIAALDVLIYFGDLTEVFAGAAARLEPGGVFAFSHETATGDHYKLRPSGRFAHAASYVDSLSRKDFISIASADTTLRLETNQPVGGRLVLLRRL
jgi:predicted TPR repeat methyltransferase